MKIHRSITLMTNFYLKITSPQSYSEWVIGLTAPLHCVMAQPSDKKYKPVTSQITSDLSRSNEPINSQTSQ